MNKICQEFGLPLSWQAVKPEAACYERGPVEVNSCVPTVQLDPAFQEYLMATDGAGTVRIALFMDNKTLVDGMNGIAAITQPDVQPLLVRTGRVWEKILERCRTRRALRLEFAEASPLRWVKRQYNAEADHLCHQKFELKQSWRTVVEYPQDVRLLPGDCIAVWSDGGFDQDLGGTAAYVVSVRRHDQWQRLASGGCYDGCIFGNDAFRMEAIGMELAFLAINEYLT